MIFEYMLYIFIIIGFVMGFIRGWKQELFAFLSMFVSFIACLYLYEPIKTAIFSIVDLHSIFDISIVNYIFTLFGFSYYTFESLLIGGLIFLVFFLVLSIIFNTLLFRKTKKMDRKIEKDINVNDTVTKKKASSFGGGSRLLGGFVGLVTGYVLGLVLIVPFATLNTTFFASGFLSNLALNIPLIGDKLKHLFDICGVIL